jgi:hypothetical protein
MKETPKIIVRIEIWHTTVVFQILEMDERARNTTNKDFISKNNMKIISESRPAIYCDNAMPSYIYLRGTNKAMDFAIVSHWSQTQEAAEEIVRNITYALEDWAKNAPCFKSDLGKTSIDTNSPNIYSF